MINRTKRLLWSVGVAAVFCASSALADPPEAALTIDVNSATGSQLDGEYTSPYPGTVNGVPTPIICDDFSTQIGFTGSWTAYVIPVSQLPTYLADLKFQGLTNGGYDTSSGDTLTTLQAYTAAADLAVQLTNASTVVQADGASPQEELSYAIWQLFDPAGDPFSKLSSTQEADAELFLSAAETAAFKGTISASQYTNVTVYTPVPQTASQEFISVDEAPAPALLGLYLLSGFGLFIMFRKRASAR
jgi:hypothetical protein